MSCTDPGCPYPVARDGLCVRHWNLRNSDPRSTDQGRVVTTQEIAAMPTKTASKKLPRGQKWAWLADALKKQDEVTFRAADHDLTTSQRDMSRISGSIRGRNGLRNFRFSIRAHGEMITVRKMLRFDEDRQPEPKKAPPIASPPVKAKPLKSNAVRELEAIREKLLAQREEIESKLDATERVMEFLQEMDSR